jgi:hypothetical protein
MITNIAEELAMLYVEERRLSRAFAAMSGKCTVCEEADHRAELRGSSEPKRPSNCAICRLYHIQERCTKFMGIRDFLGDMLEEVQGQIFLLERRLSC